MINSKLILIEGLPGGGKSTSSHYLGTVFQRCGIVCDCFLEDDDPHPIPCLDFEIKGLTQKTIPLWRTFAERAAQESKVTIIESRLWQNTALFMLMSNVGVDEIVDFNQQTGKALDMLSPALIYLDQPDVDSALYRMASIRGDDWIKSTLRDTIDYPWFKSRGIHDFDGWVSFFEEWHSVVELLFNDWPFRKTRILNPHDDWTGAYKKMHTFLQVDYNPDSAA